MISLWLVIIHHREGTKLRLWRDNKQDVTHEPLEAVNQILLNLTMETINLIFKLRSLQMKPKDLNLPVECSLTPSTYLKNKVWAHGRTNVGTYTEAGVLDKERIRYHLEGAAEALTEVVFHLVSLTQELNNIPDLKGEVSVRNGITNAFCKNHVDEVHDIIFSNKKEN